MIRFRNPALFFAALAGFISAGGLTRKGAEFWPFTVGDGAPVSPEPPPPPPAPRPVTGEREAARRRRQLERQSAKHHA